MAITKIQRLSLPVSDQDRAKRFYTEALGFEVLGDDPVPFDPGARWLELAPKNAATSVVLTTWLEMPSGGVSGLMLHTDDLDGDIGRLRAEGADVEGPTDTPWGRQATFTDPDGNGFVLTQAT